MPFFDRVWSSVRRHVLMRVFNFLKVFTKGWHPYPKCHTKRQIDVCGWVGLITDVLTWQFGDLWLFQGIENSFYEDCQVLSTHCTTITHLGTHCPSPFPSYYVTLKNAQASIEIKSTFNTKRSRESKIGDVEIRDHSKSWRNISDLLKHENITHLLYFDAFNAYAFALENILKCV